MKRRNLFLCILAMFSLIPFTASSKKPKLVGTVWLCNQQKMLMDVGMVGKKETFIFMSKTEVNIISIEAVHTVLTGTPREIVDTETGETTIYTPPAHHTTVDHDNSAKCTYKMKKVKVNGKKVYRVYITVDGNVSEYTIDGDHMIPATASLSDQRIFVLQK